MKNRAKCKLCNDIIESFHRSDMVSCKCGEISIDGGAEICRVLAKDLSNVLRIDDEGNIIIPKIVEKAPHTTLDADISPKPTKAELLDLLDKMRSDIEQLPSGAAIAPVTHYDFASLIMLLSSILRSD
jgi:hypothetical protein